MRKVKVLYKKEEAGMLIQHNDGSFTFKYNNNWLSDNSKKAISLTLPKNKQEYNSKTLFPFFYNMLPEGSNKQTICKHNKIDKTDYFGLLITTAINDSIGAVTVIKI